MIILQRFKIKLKSILGRLHNHEGGEISEKLKMLINSKEKDFTIFGMIELKRMTLVDVSFVQTKC